MLTYRLVSHRQMGNRHDGRLVLKGIIECSVLLLLWPLELFSRSCEKLSLQHLHLNLPTDAGISLWICYCINAGSSCSASTWQPWTWAVNDLPWPLYNSNLVQHYQTFNQRLCEERICRWRITAWRIKNHLRGGTELEAALNLYVLCKINLKCPHSLYYIKFE